MAAITGLVLEALVVGLGMLRRGQCSRHNFCGVDYSEKGKSMLLMVLKFHFIN